MGKLPFPPPTSPGQPIAWSVGGGVFKIKEKCGMEKSEDHGFKLPLGRTGLKLLVLDLGGRDRDRARLGGLVYK